MINQFSAGGIVFKGNKVLVVQNSSIKDKKVSFWGFPKGHLNEGESSKNAALREVEEETGIKGKIIDKVGQSKYFFSQNGGKIFKVVTIFKMEYVSGDSMPQVAEINEVKWLDPDEAMKFLTFKNDKDLLKKALTHKR